MRVGGYNSSPRRPGQVVKAWLLQNGNPPLRGERISRTHGNSSATMAADPSVEALSTTMTSASTTPPPSDVLLWLSTTPPLSDMDPSAGHARRHARRGVPGFEFSMTIRRPHDLS